MVKQTAKHGVIARRLQTFLTAKRAYPGWFIITGHSITSELHATKGWRATLHTWKEHKVAKMPTGKEWRASHLTIHRWLKPVKDKGVVRLSPEHMEKARLRHPWYRKQLGKVSA